MDAKDVPITTLLDGAKQFIVPIFQRDYSWGTKQCLALWNDIIRVGSNNSAKGHFLGSVVYIAAEDNAAVRRDVSVLESFGLIDSREEPNPGHGRRKIITPRAAKYQLLATI